MSANSQDTLPKPSFIVNRKSSMQTAFNICTRGILAKSQYLTNRIPEKAKHTQHQHNKNNTEKQPMAYL